MRADHDRNRRRAERTTAELEPGLKPALAEELLAAGWTVRPRAPDPGGLPAAGLAVLGAAGSALDGALSTASQLRETGVACVALLVERLDPMQAALAARTTPFVLPLDMDAAAIAALLVSAADLAGRACRQEAAASSKERPLLCIRLGESVELDGRPLALGVAERNFLFELAWSDGAVKLKDDDVDVGGGRPLKARECRRRLGKRLGKELASLLVPESRLDPYRLRTAREHELLGAIRLRIVGRAGVRLAFGRDVDRYPTDPDLL